MRINKKNIPCKAQIILEASESLASPDQHGSDFRDRERGRGEEKGGEERTREERRGQEKRRDIQTKDRRERLL